MNIKHNKINAVFFDLDGTLLDTAPDLAFALNQTLRDHDREPLTIEQIRWYVHGGSKSMVCMAFEIEDSHPEFENIKKRFLNHYSQHLTKETRFFDGMEAVLDDLENRQVPWGIITNKPGWLTEPILQHFELDKRSHCNIAGDTLARRKPHPDQLYHACEITQSKPDESLYVGDTEQDITAAHRAGMHAIAATYGYHRKGANPEDWQADHLIQSPLEILDWLAQHK